MLAAPPAFADLYRWKDAEGKTHYAEELERVPAAFRSSAEAVAARRIQAKGPLPVLGVERAPGPDEAGFDEPGLGERDPVEPPTRAAEPERMPGPTPDPSPVSEPAPTSPPPPSLPPQGPEAPPGRTATPPEPPPADADPREIEIAELEQELAARREELRALISQSSFDSSQISADPRLRELAEIVPRLQAELDALRGELGQP